MSKSVAIIGSGPAGLMAASVLSDHKIPVVVFEKKRGPGPKLLIAGKSGLNVSYSSDKDLWEWYNAPQPRFKKIFEAFGVTEWLAFIHDLGIKTFLGTSRRYFVEGLKAGPLLKNWMDQLKNRGVEFCYDHEFTNFEVASDSVTLKFNRDQSKTFSAACLCLGGASWEPEEKPLRWPVIFKRKKIPFESFQASNVGYEVIWTEPFLKEAEGMPLKNVTVSSMNQQSTGDVMITSYGLEGTPIYNIREPGPIRINLKPDLSPDEILSRISKGKENLNPIRWIKKYLGLSPAAMALLYHHGIPSTSIDDYISQITAFPLALEKKRPLDEAISASGGLSWEALDENLMLKNHPGIFCAGEMLDWDAPTGGFLIQACVSQGHYAGEKILQYLRNHE